MLDKIEKTDWIYIAAIVVQLGVIIYFVTRSKKIKAQKEPEIDTDSYDGKRKLAMNVTPAQLKLAIPDSQTLVYGVIMDWSLGDAVVTLAAYITGAASMYLNSGVGVSGGGKSPAVGEAAVTFVTSAQEFMGRAMPVGTTDLPVNGGIRFYMLTNKGIYGAQELMAHFEDGSSPWLSLFEKGNEVITEIKNVDKL